VFCICCSGFRCKRWSLTSRLSITSSLTQRMNMFSPWLSVSFLQTHTVGIRNREDHETKAIAEFNVQYVSHILCQPLVCSGLEHLNQDVPGCESVTWLTVGSRSTAGLPADQWIQTCECTAWADGWSWGGAPCEGHRAPGSLRGGNGRHI